MALIKIVMITRDYFERSLLESYDFASKNVTIVDYGYTGFDAIALYKKHKPDILIMPLLMPGKCAVTTAHKLLRHHPTAKLIIKIDKFNPFFIQIISNKNLASVVSSQISVDKLIKVLHEIDSEEIYVLREYKNLFARLEKYKAPQAFYRLTDGEIDTMLGLLQGKTIGKIADEMQVKRETIYAHRRHLLEKLALESVIALHQLARKYRIDS